MAYLPGKSNVLTHLQVLAASSDMREARPSSRLKIHKIGFPDRTAEVSANVRIVMIRSKRHMLLTGSRMHWVASCRQSTCEDSRPQWRTQWISCALHIFRGDSALGSTHRHTCPDYKTDVRTDVNPSMIGWAPCAFHTRQPTRESIMYYKDVRGPTCYSVSFLMTRYSRKTMIYVTR